MMKGAQIEFRCRHGRVATRAIHPAIAESARKGDILYFQGVGDLEILRRVIDVKRKEMILIAKVFVLSDSERMNINTPHASIDRSP
jgi:hypothetical protein